MIDPSLFIHPSIAIPATSLVLVAFVLKARKKKYYRADYAVAMAAFILKSRVLVVCSFHDLAANFNSTSRDGHDLRDTNFSPIRSRNHHASAEEIP